MSILGVAAKTALNISQPEFDTNTFSDRLRARDFVWQYAKTFCVYCPVTHNLYVDYDFFNTDGERNVVVLPKSDDMSTFSRIGESVIQQTPLMLVPNGKMSRAHIFNRRQRHQSLPASGTLLRLSASKNLMPVILKSDLRRLKSDLPFLMLHSIKLSSLSSHSTFNRSQIRTAIIEKLEEATVQWRC